MHIFEYSGITESIPSDIVDTLSKIESLRALDPIRKSVYGKELQKAMDACRIESAIASLTLEDIPYDADDSGIQYNGIVKSLQSTLVEKEVPSLDEKGLLLLHRTIVNGYTKRDSRFRMRDHEDVRDPHVHNIKPARPKDIGTCVDQMSSSYNMAHDVGIQSIFLIPCVVIDLLNIHPFQEANWRVSRVLMEALLSSEGYFALEVSSLDKHLLDNREEYYDSVAESSAGWNNNDSDPFPFIRFVSEMVLDCYKDMDERYPLNSGKKVKKNERIARIVENSDGPLSKAEICSLLPDVSVRTADVVLTKLSSEGRIKKIGSYKDARYASSDY